MAINQFGHDGRSKPVETDHGTHHPLDNGVIDCGNCPCRKEHERAQCPNTPKHEQTQDGNRTAHASPSL